MLAGLADNVKEELGLNDVPMWSIASPLDCNSLDEVQFSATCAALEQLNLGHITPQLWKLFGALLHLGNINFIVGEEIGACWDTEDQHHLKSAAHLLGLNSNELFQVITVRNFQAGTKSPAVLKPCSSQNECETRRDTLIKLLYRLTFDMLLKEINKKLQNSNSPKYSNHKHLCEFYFSNLFDLKLHVN